MNVKFDAEKFRSQNDRGAKLLYYSFLRGILTSFCVIITEIKILIISSFVVTGRS